MENGDEIDVVVEQVGGSQNWARRSQNHHANQKETKRKKNKLIDCWYGLFIKLIIIF